MMWESLLFITVLYWWIDTFDLCIDLCFCSSSWLDVHRVRYCRTTLLPCGCHLPLTNSLCTSLRSARSLMSSVQLVLFVRCVSLIHVFWISGFNPFQSRVAIGRQGLLWLRKDLPGSSPSGALLSLFSFPCLWVWEFSIVTGFNFFLFVVDVSTVIFFVLWFCETYMNKSISDSLHLITSAI